MDVAVVCRGWRSAAAAWDKQGDAGIERTVQLLGVHTPIRISVDIQQLGSATGWISAE
jgi:hypothetical protein